MNEKAAVTKELNDKHRKMLEGMLKLPENKECADCKSRGPRWASVNLGIFVCMQCSGIHRSLGVHISKVRSATLDTWLPEQVAFMQTMGNVKANTYWEARLPPNYDRVGIENFIRAKYEDKRWVPLDKNMKPPSMTEEMKSPEMQKKPDKNEESPIPLSQKQEKFVPQNTRKDNAFVPKLPKPGQASYESKIEPVRTMIDSPDSSEIASASVNAPNTSSHNAMPSTDLFNMLSMEDSPSNVPESSSVEDDNWANFQSAESVNPIDQATPSESLQGKKKTESGVEDLFSSPLETVQSDNKNKAGVMDLFSSPSESVQTKDNNKSGVEDLFSDFSSASTPQKPQTDVKKDILSLFEKTNMVSPYALQQQQQLAYISQQQGLLMAAAKSSNGTPVLPADRSPHVGSDSVLPNGNLQAPNWGNLGFQVASILQSSGQQFNYPQHLGSALQTHPYGIYNSPASGVHPVGSAELTFENSNGNMLKTPAPTPASTPSQSLDDFDFSSLTKGLFSKH